MKLSRTLLILAGAGILALTGCTAAEPAPSATATASTPTPTPAPVAEPEVRVVVTTLTLDVYEDDVLTGSWRHADRDPGEIPGLTEAFGSEPESRTETRPGEGSPNDWQYLSWSGLELRFITSQYGPRTVWVTVTAPSVGDVEIEALGGIQVGDDAQAVASAHPDFADQLEAPEGAWLRIGIDPIPAGFESGDRPAADFVSVRADDPFTTVTEIRAPAANYGM